MKTEMNSKIKQVLSH